MASLPPILHYLHHHHHHYPILHYTTLHQYIHTQDARRQVATLTASLEHTSRQLQTQSDAHAAGLHELTQHSAERNAALTRTIEDLTLTLQLKSNGLEKLEAFRISTTTTMQEKLDRSVTTINSLQAQLHSAGLSHSEGMMRIMADMEGLRTRLEDALSDR